MAWLVSFFKRSNYRPEPKLKLQTQAQYLFTFEHDVLQMGSGDFVRAFI